MQEQTDLQRPRDHIDAAAALEKIADVLMPAERGIVALMRAGKLGGYVLDLADVMHLYFDKLHKHTAEEGLTDTERYEEAAAFLDMEEDEWAAWMAERHLDMPWPDEQTIAPPGDDRKIELMYRRVKAGRQPFHPDDETMPIKNRDRVAHGSSRLRNGRTVRMDIHLLNELEADAAADEAAACEEQQRRTSRRDALMAWLLAKRGKES